MIKLLLTHNAMFKGDQTSIWSQPCLPWSQNTPSHNSGECTNIPTTTICTNKNNATNKTLPPPTKLYHLTFQVLALEPPEAGSIPLWILILAILAGLLFLSILTAILYKLGFFR